MRTIFGTLAAIILLVGALEFIGVINIWPNWPQQTLIQQATLCDQPTSQLSPKQVQECSNPSPTPDVCDQASGNLSPNQIAQCNERIAQTTPEPAQPTQPTAPSPAPEVTPEVTPVAPTAAPEQPTNPQPAGNDDNIRAQSSGTACANMTDMESMTRSTVDMATMNNWFHPIYDTSAYQRSGGTEGQWSWFNSLCLLTADGGQFMGYENVDGAFVFRVNTTKSYASFAIATTQAHRSQFMNGKDSYPASINVKTIPGTTVEIFDPRTGKAIGAQTTSALGGDLLIQLPDQGIVGIRFPINDPAASLEARFWVGPDDRLDSNINRFDARALTR